MFRRKDPEKERIAPIKLFLGGFRVPVLHLFKFFREMAKYCIENDKVVKLKEVAVAVNTSGLPLMMMLHSIAKDEDNNFTIDKIGKTEVLAFQPKTQTEEE